jgi:acyl-CoA reductase-like NAD-dependent aldehyde dehydrogenase
VDEVGLPAGVFNLVSGEGAVVGEAMAAHPEVDMVSFTGSTRAGRRVAQVGAETIKKVTLELGGKSANVLLDDLDDETFERAVKDGVVKAFANSGQTCSALTRMLVPRDRLAEAERIAAAATEATVVGDPFEKAVHLGPLASAAQRDRVQHYIQVGLDEGARIVAGGLGRPEGVNAGGYFVRPTVFSDVTPSMTIAKEEIFGPVLVLMAHDGDDDAVAVANGVVYGLSGGVWSGDDERAMAVARRLRTGQVEVNGGRFNPNAPFGGYKQSGVGREYGTVGFEEFLEVKSIQR